MEHDNMENMNRSELMENYQQMREMASRDSLTDLFNRRGLEQMIDQKLSEMGESEGCALFIVDLDNFKNVNDTLGHQSGDKVLGNAARLLSGMFRANDVVGRLGGDEFVIFLCGNVDEALVREKAQNICDQLQFVMGDGAGIFVTASVGVHMALGKKQNFEFLYRSADLALYKAKKKGKQCYCIKRNTDDANGGLEETHTPVNAVRLRGLLDYIDSGVAMVDMRKDHFIYASPAFARMLGIDAKRLSERKFFEFVHPDERRELELLFRDRVMNNNETLSHVARMVRVSGDVMWWRIHGVRVEYGETQPVMFITVTDVSDLKQKEQSLRENNDLYQMALEQTMQGIWEVELDTRMFRMMGENSRFGALFEEPVAFPVELIRSGWIFGESGDEFLEFAEGIFEGRTQGYGNFMIKYDDTNQYGWASFSYRMVFDEAGRPVRVVGIIEGIQQESEDTEDDRKNAPMPEGLMSSLVSHVVGNVTKDTLSTAWLEGRDVTSDVSYATLSQLMAREKGRMFSPEILKRFPYYFSLEGFERAYREEGERWMSFEYQRVDGGGVIRWVSCALNLYQDERDGDLHLATWVCRLDLRRFWEATLGTSIYKDPITKLYTRSTFREMSNRLLEEGEDALRALVLVEIGGMARMYAQSEDDVESQYRAIVTAILLSVGTGCIPGQFGKDRMLLFFPDVISRESLKRRLEQAFVFVRKVTSDLVDESLIRFLAVGICRQSGEADLEIMLKKVQFTCGLWSNASEDRIVFADEDETEEWERLRQSRDLDHVLTQNMEQQRPLSEREKDAAFECLLGMLKSESLTESAKLVLSTLGKYFQADRTYILAPVEYGHVVTMPHEWTAAHKNSIQQAVSGSLTSNFPLLERCAKENKPIFMTRRKQIGFLGMKNQDREEAWHFAVFPMRNDGKPQSYLCIENARKYETDAGLPMMLSECLVKERNKYLRNSRHAGGENVPGVDVPNLASFMETIYNYNSEVYSALGAVCVDVPDIVVINDSHGFEYGRRLLWYVINTMAEVFGKTMLFRTWDAEFVVLCPNTTQQVFFGKCSRLRAMITRRYPNEVRIGFTWADKVFSGKELVDEARSLMHCDGGGDGKAPVRNMNLPSELALYESVGEMLNAGRFTVFFQPKFDLRTGDVSGAEALIRALDDNGKAIPPVRFVEEMERSGAIRDLDLFVLDRTMHVLDQWREQGYDPPPVSVNFSRVTLFDTRVLASLLAIQSRYPKLDPGLIEIEITESAGNVSQETLSEIMGRFREYGVTFALDDFGSKYSNLAIFTNVRFDTVKLDMSLVSEVVRNEKSQMLVRDIIGICEKGGMKCIAEGVETVDQILVLKKCGLHVRPRLLF